MSDSGVTARPTSEPSARLPRTVLTYGTFDLFHVGHLNILRNLKALGDHLVVGVSTDEFNAIKGKKTIIPYHDRAEILKSIRCVDQVFAETCWEQKRQDIHKWGAQVLGMGADWHGKFDDLKDVCEVVYLPRTSGVSSTSLKRVLNVLDQTHVADLKSALDILSSIIRTFD